MRSRSGCLAIAGTSIALALLGLAAMASRGLYGVALDGRVERIEIRHEKHPPIDDVHLVYVNGDSTHVDRQLARQFSRGVPLHKGRLDNSVTIGGRTVDLRASTDLRRAAVVMPLMLLLIALLLAVRSHPRS